MVMSAYSSRSILFTLFYLKLDYQNINSLSAGAWGMFASAITVHDQDQQHSQTGVLCVS
jgi:hypothetical protein